MPALSAARSEALDRYAGYLQEEVDLRPATVRHYLSDLRQFTAWCESAWSDDQDREVPFEPAALTTPVLTRYRAHLQHTQRLKPASVNRALIAIKRYCAWAAEVEPLAPNPAAVIKPVR